MRSPDLSPGFVFYTPFYRKTLKDLWIIFKSFIAKYFDIKNVY